MYNVFYLTKSIGNKRNNENVQSRNNINFSTIILRCVHGSSISKTHKIDIKLTKLKWLTIWLTIENFLTVTIDVINSLWLWRWLPHRLSTTTVLFRTTSTRTIIHNLLLNWLLVGSNLSQHYNNDHKLTSVASFVTFPLIWMTMTQYIVNPHSYL